MKTYPELRKIREVLITPSYTVKLQRLRLPENKYRVTDKDVFIPSSH